VKQFFQKLAWYPPAETKIPLRAILSALLSKSNDFEKTLCSFLKVERCVLGNSGRSLLSSLLEILKQGDNDERNEVLIPGYTCYSVASSVARAGLKIRTYDLDPLSLEPDLDSVTKAAGEETLAIIIQHLFGIPAPVNRIQEIGRDVGAYLIEDAAQGLGGSIGGRFLGTIGDFGFYSFGRGKPLPLGGGGAMVGKDLETLSNLRRVGDGNGYVQLSSTLITQFMSLPFCYWIPEHLPIGLGETIFTTDFGISGMPAIMQNLAENSIANLDDLNLHRRRVAGIYNETFVDAFIFPVPDEAIPIYTRFPVKAGAGPISKDLKRLGVRRMYPKAITDVDIIKPYLAETQSNTPGTLEIARNLITLPTHMGITENLAKEIAHKVKTKNQLRIYG
jgi:dTDP-4-amino-4,6-dideoxygalactose transaminase